MKRIIRDCYEQLYAKKLDYVDKMDKFLEIHKLPKLTWRNKKNLNRSVTTKDIELATKTFSQRCRGPYSFTGDFYQTFEEELKSILHKLLQKMETEGYLPALSKRLVLPCCQNQRQTAQENYRLILDTKDLSKILAN